MDFDLKSRLTDAIPEVDLAASAFEAAARISQLHLLKQADFTLTNVTKNEMVSLYDNRFVKSPGRPMYDAILLSAKGDRCPMCGVRDVGNLDHALPKTAFPAIAVAPLNLVPVCPICNKTKLNKVSTIESDQALHPYFDHIEHQRWLYAKVLQKLPTAFQFFVGAPPEWSDVLGQRVEGQFKDLGLAKLYMSQANQELSSIRHSLQSLHRRTGVDGVRKRISEDAASKRTNELNSWRTAMYEAMERSAWFHDGGFLMP